VVTVSQVVAQLPHIFSSRKPVAIQGSVRLPLACHAIHAIPLGSDEFAGVQEVLFCKAFSSYEFTAVRFNSKYSLTETLTFCEA